MNTIWKAAAGDPKDLPTARSPAIQLLVAAGLAVAVWLIARVVLHAIFPFYHSPYLLATVAVLISASVAGPGAGLLTTAMLAPVAFLVMDDPDSLPLRAERWQDAANTSLFVIIGGAISLL